MIVCIEGRGEGGVLKDEGKGRFGGIGYAPSATGRRRLLGVGGSTKNLGLRNEGQRGY